MTWRSCPGARAELLRFPVREDVGVASVTFFRSRLLVRAAHRGRWRGSRHVTVPPYSGQHRAAGPHPQTVSRPQPSPRTPSARWSCASSGKADGPPTLFVPGLMSAGKVWEANAERHAAGYRVHVLTLGGVAGTTPVQAEPFLAAVRSMSAPTSRKGRCPGRWSSGTVLVAFSPWGLRRAHPTPSGQWVRSIVYHSCGRSPIRRRAQPT